MSKGPRICKVVRLDTKKVCGQILVHCGTTSKGIQWWACPRCDGPVAK